MLSVVAPERISADSKPAKAEIRRGVKISSWEGASGQIHSALATSSLLTGFALPWDANDSQLGLLGAIPFLGQLGQLAGTYLVDRFANRRRVVVALLGLAARSTWFILAVLPFLLPARSRLTILVILLFFFWYQLAYCASGPGWVAWMAALVPARLRGRYLGRRNRIMELVGMAAVLFAGWAIDVFRAAGGAGINGGPARSGTAAAGSHFAAGKLVVKSFIE